MSQVIAGMYEIEKKIGSGGGGTVYLGRHIRLQKTVVLKADKRQLSIGDDALKREVNVLKNLSHTYIPQVYDFVQEDGTVYTVMDYIEGESLDKLLDRKQIPSQAQVVRWACQLLEALSYLHGRPPHGILHGDIKPANIMLRPDGNICLIDYNIALALGEDGAVKVGFSRGYASPEHYGKSYLSDSRSAAVGQISYLREKSRRSSIFRSSSAKKSENAEDSTLLLGNEPERAEDSTLLLGNRTENADNGTLPLMNKTGSGKDKASESHAVLLDVRSDIYSLGATLYHLISGKRPALDAEDVVPLGTDVCSQAVSNIIQKSMAPDPNMRYQTAEEMREAFLNLYEADVRTVHYKKQAKILLIMTAASFLLGGALTFIGLKRLEGIQRSLALAEYSADSLARGDMEDAVKKAMQAISQKTGILRAPVTAQAVKALTDALGVYDLSDGFKNLGLIELPSAPFDMVLSPDGSKAAIVYAYEMAVYDLEKQEKIIALPIQNSALADAAFLDNSKIAYAGDKGLTVYDLGTKEVCWMGDATTKLTVSADKKVIAAVNRDDNTAVIYNAMDGEKLTERDFGEHHMTIAANDIFADPEQDIFALNEDGSRFAVSFEDGGLCIFDLEERDRDFMLYDTSDYRYFKGGFYKQYFAYAAQNERGSILEIIETDQAVSLGSYDSQNEILVQTNSEGIYAADGDLLVSIDPEGFAEKELAYREGSAVRDFFVGKEHILLATDNKVCGFYDKNANLISEEPVTENSDFVMLAGMYAVIGNRTETSVRVMKLEGHEKEQLLSYDADYVHDEARISNDGKTIMLFSSEGFCIYDTDGSMIIRESLPDAATIYDQQFIKADSDSWLEVTWYDGTVRCYSARDGRLLSEKNGEKPNKDLYEEFYTDQYVISSSLHDAPAVYDKKSNKLAGKLEQDAYLTYVTQIDQYIITEYISAEGERFAFLLDDKLQKLAYLPNLCDVNHGMLVFDYESGNLRQCRLYSLRELLALGETYD